MPQIHLPGQKRSLFFGNHVLEPELDLRDTVVHPPEVFGERRQALDDAFRQLPRTESPNLTENNHRFHRLLIDGVPVNYQGDGGPGARSF